MISIRTLVALGVAVLATPALAQDSGPVADFDAGGEGFVIIGKEHLPDFTVQISRENLSKAYDLELKESFLPKIVDAVKEAPF